MTWRSGSSQGVLILSFLTLTGGCYTDPSAPLVDEDLLESGVEQVRAPRTGTMGVGINSGFYNPAAGMRLFAEGYNTAAWVPGDQPFYEPFLADMAPFETIRFHQFHSVSFSNDVEWSDRTPPTHQVHLSGWQDLAMPYEWSIRLCNTLDANYWINIPAKASEDYVAELARLVHDQLDPELNIYVEYSNEVWNPDYSEGAWWDDVPGVNGQFTVASDLGMELGLSEDPNVARSRYYVYASVRIWQAFIDEFGDDDRLVKVIATVNDEDFFWEGGLLVDALQDPVINPNGLRPDEWSMAAYVGAEHDGASPTLFDAELQSDLDRIIQGFQLTRSGLDQAGYTDVRLSAYEGGTHTLMNADVANRSPVIYDFYLQLLDELEMAGLDNFQHYVATTEHYEGAAFGFKEYTGQPEDEAPKWRALRDWILEE